MDKIEDHLSYDPETGVFAWKVKASGRQMNRQPGWVNGGYRHIEVLGKVHRCHNLAWYFHHGEWPERTLDHIDADGTNNRIANLRLAQHAENCANRRKPSSNKSGVKGVCWHKATGKWQASIKVNQRAIHLGVFATKEEAAAAYWKAAQQHFGEFARAA